MQRAITILASESYVSNNQSFHLNTKMLHGDLIMTYYITSRVGQFGHRVISYETSFTIQHRKDAEEDLYFIHAYGKAVKDFSTLGEAVGVLINEIIGESK